VLNQSNFAMAILLIIYDLLLCLIIPFYIIGLAIKGKLDSSILERFGVVSQDLKERISKTGLIWLHAVSLGEVSSCKLLIKELGNLYFNKKILITTITSTGRKLAESLKQENKNIEVVLLPFDLSFLIANFIRFINPKILILVETELWPNMLYQIKKKNIAVVVINARISDRSFRRYSIFKWLFKYFNWCIDYFCAQSDTDKNRLLSLDISKEKIKVTGNMKFDSIEELKPEEILMVSSLKEKLSIREDELFLVAGSTHKPEEEYLLDAFICLKKKFISLRLLIAPRHLERLSQIERLISNRGLKSQRLTQIRKVAKDEILLLDTIGQLHLIYTLATVVFVGGSLAKVGGHNFLEAACFKKPILVGPYMYNFKEIADYFISNGGIIQLDSKDKLAETLDSLLSSSIKRTELANRANSLLLAKQKATLRNLEIISKYIS